MFMLSIIVPFFNSEHKCCRLLSTLSRIFDTDVEIILIDDGSSDGTLSVIEAFEENANTHVRVLKQKNKGPGGARNAGISVAAGKYVWFVDSDDDINLKAIEVLRENYLHGYDFIDFNIRSQSAVINSMEFQPGTYHNSELSIISLIRKFGRIWSKILRKDIIDGNNLYYIGQCYSDDNALVFLYPFFINKFMKSDVVGYNHHEEYESIQRGLRGPRYLDRLYTAAYGFKYSSRLATTRRQHELLSEKFVKQYLINTVSGVATKQPSRGWLLACRVMKNYRFMRQRLGVNINEFSLLPSSYKFKALFGFLYILSFFLGDQSSYFDRLHYEGWGVEFPEKI